MVSEVRIFGWDQGRGSCIVVADTWDCTWTSVAVFLPVVRRAVGDHADHQTGRAQSMGLVGRPYWPAHAYRALDLSGEYLAPAGYRPVNLQVALQQRAAA